MKIDSYKPDYSECYWCDKILTGKDLKYSERVQLSICKSCDLELEAIIHEHGF